MEILRTLLAHILISIEEYPFSTWPILGALLMFLVLLIYILIRAWRAGPVAVNHLPMSKTPQPLPMSKTRQPQSTDVKADGWQVIWQTQAGRSLVLACLGDKARATRLVDLELNRGAPNRHEAATWALERIERDRR